MDGHCRGREAQFSALVATSLYGIQHEAKERFKHTIIQINNRSMCIINYITEE